MWKPDCDQLKSSINTICISKLVVVLTNTYLYIYVNPQGNADVASFVVQNMRYPSGTQECVLDVCTQGYIECNLIYSCYIAIPLHQGAFELSSQLIY